MILRLTTAHEKGLDSRSPAFEEDKFRGNDNPYVIPAKLVLRESGGAGSTVVALAYFHGSVQRKLGNDCEDRQVPACTWGDTLCSGFQRWYSKTNSGVTSATSAFR